MRNNFFKSLIIVLSGWLLLSFTVPAANNHLFSIGRNKDANEIYYTVNLDKSNRLNLETPIQPYWLKKTKNNRVEPLTHIQKKYSYGVVYLKKTQTYVRFRFAGYKDRVFELKKNKKGVYQVFTVSKGKEVVVNRIFIYITGGTFWIPEVSQVNMYALDTESDRNVVEIIKP